MQVTPISIRERVVKRAEELYASYKKPHQGTSNRHCLFYARAVHEALKERGIRSVIQAGSASWPFIEPEDDDGVSPTNFSYVWEADSAVTHKLLRQCTLPELHVWVAIPKWNEIVDLTHQYLKENVEAAGFKWQRKQLPAKYIWQRAETLDDMVQYHPCPLAIKVALAFMMQYQIECMQM